MNTNTDGLKKSSLFHVLIIAVLAIGLYSNTLKNGFVYDDSVTIMNNAFIDDIGNLSKFIGIEEYLILSGERTYRPVVTFTYFLDYAVFGLKPWGYHLTNILLHSINGILVYIFLALFIKPTCGNISPFAVSRMFANTPLPLSLLFVAHPILTEAVNAISFREDLLAFFFYLVTLILYMKVKTNRVFCFPIFITYLLSCITYLLALLSKEMAVTLPFIIYCYEWVYAEKKNKKSHFVLPNFYNMGYLFIALAILFLHFSYYFSVRLEDAPSWGIWKIKEGLLTLPWLLLNYMKLTIFPASLSADYEISPVSHLSSLLFAVPLIILISVLATALLIKNWRQEITFGTLFFIMTLIPVYNLIPISSQFAERYLYLPVVGSAIIVGILFVNPIASLYSRGKAKHYPLILFFALLSLYSIITINRNKIWIDNYSLFSDIIRKMPDSNRAHFNLGLIYIRQGRLEKAIQEFKTLIKINPLHDDAHYNLGWIYDNLGKKEDAISEYLSVLKLNQKHVKARHNLGFAYLSLGLKDKAKTEFEIILKLKPDNTMVRKVLETLEVP